MRRGSKGAAAALAALLLPAGVASAAPRKLSLDEVLDLTLRQNLDLPESDARAEQAAAETKSARGNLLPKLHIEWSGLIWDRPFTIPFGGQPVSVRDQSTSALTLSATQPLTGLVPLIDVKRSDDKLEDAARVDGQTVRAQLVYRATEAYLRLLEAIDIGRIAEETVREIEEQVRTAHALVEGGTLIQADELRTQVALAQARQDLLRATANVATLGATLAAVAGLPVTDEIEPRPIDPGELPVLPASAAELLAGVSQKRPEVRAAALRADAAASFRKASVALLFPAVSVGAAYQRYDGFGFIQQTNSGYVGAFVSWNFWEWGATFYAAESAKARANLAQTEVLRIQRDVSLEVVRRYHEARATFAAIAVARSAVDQAREANRVTHALYVNGSATTTESLDAEVALERARLNDARATYDALVAYAALTRAAGTAAWLPGSAAPAGNAPPGN